MHMILLSESVNEGKWFYLYTASLMGRKMYKKEMTLRRVNGMEKEMIWWPKSIKNAVGPPKPSCDGGAQEH